MKEGFMTYLNKNSYFFVTTESKPFRQNLMHIINKLQFQNHKAYLDWFIILKVIDAESPIVILWDNWYL